MKEEVWGVIACYWDGGPSKHLRKKPLGLYDRRLTLEELGYLVLEVEELSGGYPVFTDNMVQSNFTWLSWNHDNIERISTIYCTKHPIINPDSHFKGK